jgi:hypothetical protein
MLSIFFSPVLLLILIIILTIWLISLSYLIIHDKKFYNKLLIGSEKDNLAGTLNKIQNNLSETKKDLEKVAEEILEEKKKSENYLKKIGMVRFNPYSDTGGQQSFSVSVLDKNNNGIIFSHLFQRQGSRWFAKKVNAGKGDNSDLSEEEQKAIESTNK